MKNAGSHLSIAVCLGTELVAFFEEVEVMLNELLSAASGASFRGAEQDRRLDAVDAGRR